VQQIGDVFRVNVRLESLNGTVLWSGGEEVRREQLFAMQTRLAESLVDTLRIRATDTGRQSLARAPTEDTQALEAYWRGLELLDRPNPDFVEAVAQFKQATARDRRFSLAFAALGETYRRQSVLTNDKALMDEATVNVRKALDIDPRQPEVRLSLASLLRSTGQSVGAMDELTQVVNDQPNNDTAHRLLGQLLAKAGRPSEALKALRRAADLRPKYWLNQEALGLFYYGNGQLPEAINAFRELTKLKPNDWLPFQQLGAMYLTQGDFNRARDNFSLSNKVKPNAGSFANLGTIAFYEQRYMDAVGEYQAAIRLEPTIAVHYGNLGDAYQRMGQTVEAASSYRRAIDLGEQALKVNPNDATTVSRLAVYYFKVGSKTQAVQYADRAASTNPTDPEVLYLRAVVLALRGEKDQAMQQLLEAVDHGYPLHFMLKDVELESLRQLPEFKRLAAEKPQ